MTQHIKKITSVALVLLCISCKKNIQDSKNESLVSDTTYNQTELSNFETTANNKWEHYYLYEAYFQSGGETDLPEITEGEVIDKFKKVNVLLSKDTISIDGIKSFYSLQDKDSKKFFDKKYLYDFNTKLYKNAFNIDLTSKVRYINLDIENNNISPFKEYFLEAGDAVYEDSSIFLNYKRYVVCLKKENNKSNNTQYCKLPFDYDRLNRLCQKDDRNKYQKLCDNEFPIHTFAKEKELKTLLEQKIKNRNLLFYYELKTQLEHIKTIVVVGEHEEESYGDQYIVNIIGNEVLLLDDSSNDFFHSMNFVINNDLTITFYENNGLNPKEKINSIYRINEDGSFAKTK